LGVAIIVQKDMRGFGFSFFFRAKIVLYNKKKGGLFMKHEIIIFKEVYREVFNDLVAIRNDKSSGWKGWVQIEYEGDSDSGKLRIEFPIDMKPELFSEIMEKVVEIIKRYY
jgi:hypothetical protein